jgi:putative component of toxin-antitoxin plasmid stabilization module
MEHYRLVKDEKLSGKDASIYSVFLEKEQETLFDRFIKENKISFKGELKDIINRIKAIGNKIGAREQFFKLKEGEPGDGVCALYDDPDKNLRLYCIRYGKTLIILGGGGQKTTQTLQDNPKLKDENYFLRQVSKDILNRMQDGEIEFSDDYMELLGNLEFKPEDYD